MNGDQSFTWAKKPALPSRKKTVDHTLNQKKLCPKCALQGIDSPIHLFQLNDEEAIWMCKNDKCTFMPSNNWESCLVKRSVCEIPTRTSRKSFDPLSSQSVHTAPLLRSKSTQSRTRSTAGSVATATTGYSSASPWSSRAPSPVDSEYSGDKEHKSLVPIGPFIFGGHAHTFASFETKRIEDRRLQRTPSYDNNFLPLRSRKPQLQRQVNPGSGKSKGKRRGSSLDSDSLSSSSGESRPLSPETHSLETDVNPWRVPEFETETIPYSNPPKKVRKIFVSAKTLSKIVDSKKNLEISEVGKPKSVAERLIIETQSDQDISGTSCSHSSEFDELHDQVNNSLPNSATIAESSSVNHLSPAEKDTPVSQLKVTPVRSTDRLELSFTKGQKLSASHIEAINAALASNSSIVIKPSFDQSDEQI